LADAKEDLSANCAWVGVLKCDWTKGRQKEGLDKNVVCHRVYSTYTVNASPTKLLKGLEASK
jgi:hypothetical protein